MLNLTNALMLNLTNALMLNLTNALMLMHRGLINLKLHDACRLIISEHHNACQIWHQSVANDKFNTSKFTV
jgi:hypothetical protein